MKINIEEIGGVENFVRIANASMEAHDEINDLLYARKYNVADTRIHRRTIHHWDQEGLLPYEYKGKGWRKFSGLEIIWLHCIQKCRDLGLALPAIKQLKNFLFEVDVVFYRAQYMEAVQALKKTGKKWDELYDCVVSTSDSELLSHLTQNQQSYFSYLVYGVLITRIPAHIVVTDLNEIFCISNDTKVSKADIDDFNLAALFNQSFVMINLRKIVTATVFGDANIYDTEQGFYQLLNKNELLVIEKIRSGECREVVVKTNEGKIKQVKSVKEVSPDKLANFVAKKYLDGNYGEIKMVIKNKKVVITEAAETVKIE